MKQSHKEVSLARLCRLFGVTRQAFYQQQWRQIDLSTEQVIVLDLVRQIRVEQPRIGGRKLYVLLEEDLKRHQIKIGRDALFDLLAVNGMLVKRKKTSPKTTDSKHHFRRYKNLTEGLLLTAPWQLWVSDITYLRVGDGFAYLSLITDAYSHKIEGHQLADNLKVELCVDALKKALKQLPDQACELIHHSDRGVQYCHRKYTSLLDKYNIRISMTQNGDPYENALAERVNGILKTELLKKHYSNLQEARKEVCRAIEVYNHRRPHMSCDYLTPAQAHFKTGVLKKCWSNKTIPLKIKT